MKPFSASFSLGEALSYSPSALKSNGPLWGAFAEPQSQRAPHVTRFPLPKKRKRRSQS